MSLEKDRMRNMYGKENVWQEWGPYLPERQWGTVRECFSAPDEAWQYTTFETAKVRHYLSGEDGIFGWCDSSGRLCFSMSFWNGVDPILKERFFGVSALEGNHGEDVKEYYYYLDAVPSYSYAKALYRYPCEIFPYTKLTIENQSRNCSETEYELIDTGVFDNSNYFDIFVEYAKGSPKDIAIQITAWNRSGETKPLHIIPQFFFRNTWEWSALLDKIERKPQIYYGGKNHIVFSDSKLGEYRLECGEGPGNVEPVLLFTENASENSLQNDGILTCKSRRDAFTQRIVYNNSEFISSKNRGTRVAVWYYFLVPANSSVSVQLRFSLVSEVPSEPLGESFTNLINIRAQEADAFYDEVLPKGISEYERSLVRQAYAGLLWSKMFYTLSTKEWLTIANKLGYKETHRSFNSWENLNAFDILSVPDKWEYPWFASWDLSFHLIPMCRIDPVFVLKQIQIFLSERYQNTTGQVPASEWNFSSINPPVIAWGVNKIANLIENEFKEEFNDFYDSFLINTFCGLYANLIWWNNLKDSKNRTLFEGGFIGLDNFRLFENTPRDNLIEEAQAVFWTPFFIGNLLELACKLAIRYPAFERIAIRLLDYYIKSINLLQGGGNYPFWDGKDSFFYPFINIEGKEMQLRARAFTGLVPLLGLVHLPIGSLPELSKRFDELIKTEKNLTLFTHKFIHTCASEEYIAISCVTLEQRDILLKYSLDESEFLSPFGLRSLSRYHREHPININTTRGRYEIKYCPGELESRIFGGNTNWFGPIWFPLNYLFIDSMEKWEISHSGTLLTELPTPFERYRFHEIGTELRKRLLNLFLPNTQGVIPSLENFSRHNIPSDWNSYHLFYEYFNGDTGEGIGASHQTGWTALIAQIIQELSKE